MIKFCSLFSGSSGNSIFFSDGTTRLLMDAGLSAKRIIQALGSIGENPCELSAILVSHEHIDHTRGAGILSRKFNTPVYANSRTWQAMDSIVGSVADCNRQQFETGVLFSLGSVTVNTFSIPHDASEPVGFSIYSDNRKITVATDIGHINEELVGHLEDSDLLLLESNHDREMLRIGPYPWSLKKRIEGDQGHLSNDAASKVIVHMAQRGMKRFLLGHLSKENNFPELAYQTVCNALQENSLCIGRDLELEVVRRDCIGTVIEF